MFVKGVATFGSHVCVVVCLSLSISSLSTWFPKIYQGNYYKMRTPIGQLLSHLNSNSLY